MKLASWRRDFWKGSSQMEMAARIYIIEKLALYLLAFAEDVNKKIKLVEGAWVYLIVLRRG
jgi:hypothetical protein